MFALLTLAVALGMTTSAAEPKSPYAELFPAAGVMYDLKLGKVMVSKDGKVYSQTAEYGWTGGRYELNEVKLVRDPSIKEEFSAEAIKKLKKPPKELEINKKKGYFFEIGEQPGKIEEVSRRLVVVLADDKAIIIQQRGAGMELEDLAKKLDFAKVEKALENPPKE